MRKIFIQGFVASLMGLLLLSACSMAGFTIQRQSAGGGTDNAANDGEEAVLLQTAQIQLVSDIKAQEALALSATPTPVSFEGMVATAVAQTQEAHDANLTFDQRVQTAIAETQAAIPLDQRIQTAIAQTQMANVIVSTPTPILANALTPIANAEFSGAYVYKYGFMSGNKYLVTIQLVNNVTGDYYAMVGNQQYKCSVMDGYPNRLYCIGPSVPGGAQPVNIYESTSTRLVYVSQVVLPRWTPTRVPYYNYCYGGYNCYNNYHYYPYYNCCPCKSKECDCRDYDWCTDECNGVNCRSRSYYDVNGKCFYFDANGVCRYCKTGNVCRRTDSNGNIIGVVK